MIGNIGEKNKLLCETKYRDNQIVRITRSGILFYGYTIQPTSLLLGMKSVKLKIC